MTSIKNKKKTPLDDAIPSTLSHPHPTPPPIETLETILKRLVGQFGLTSIKMEFDSKKMETTYALSEQPQSNPQHGEVTEKNLTNHQWANLDAILFPEDQDG